MSEQEMDRVRDKQRAYRLTFSSPSGQIVLLDLARFCFAAQDTFDPDPAVHARNVGMRRVWLMIEQHLRLPQTKLYQLYNGKSFQVEDLDDDFSDGPELPGL